MKKRQLIGLDMGEKHARIAVFDPASEMVVESGEITWEAGGSEEAAKYELASRLKILAVERDVVFSPPASQIHYLYLELPSLKKSEIGKAIRSSLGKSYYFEEDTYSIFHDDIPPLSTDSRKRGYFATLVPKKVLNDYPEFLKSLGLTVLSMEVPYAAFLRWIGWEKPELKTGTHVIAHFFPEEIFFFLTIGGLPAHVAVLKPPLIRLPEWKECSITDFKEHEPFLRNIAKTFQSLIFSLRFRKFSSEILPDGIILCGINAENEMIAQAIRESTNLPVIPFLDHKMKSPGEKENGRSRQRWVIATGLSMKIMEVTP